MFTKTSPGKACKIALVADAEWSYAGPNTIVQEATDPYGVVVAYKDCDGWFVLSTLIETNTDGVIA